MITLKNLSTATTLAVLTAVSLDVAKPAKAVSISFAPDDGVPPVVVSPFFDSLAPGGEVGTAFINKGVDFSFGEREGIFDDPPLAFSGVNSSGIVDLVSPVDARIVVPGTTKQGFTSFISAEAGYAENGSLLLKAFDTNGNLLASAVNGPPLGSNGRTTFEINRGGVFDIASFEISGYDTFGVNQVSLAEPVPEPLTILGSGIALGLGTWLQRDYSRRQKKNQSRG